VRKFILLIVVIAALVNGGAYFLLRNPPKINDPELIQPVLAKLAVTGKNIYTLDRSKEFLQAAQNPETWRQLDRREHFDAVILTGDPVTYRPLLEHLLHARDWTLTYLDHTSFGFKRAPIGGWDASSLGALEKRFANKPIPERVDFLVQLAGKLIYVDEMATARRLLEEAVKLDDKSAAAWSQLAAYFAQSSLWSPALADAEKALKVDPHFLPALQVKAQVLLAMNRADEALAVSKQMVQADPHDPEILFQHARIAHEANDYQGEIAALRGLVDSAVDAKRPVAGYRIYLGQAYSRNGERVQALEQFQQALSSGELGAEQQDYANEAIKRLGGATDAPATATPAP
jgi:tetratricopeptide (TPR) repeat protein